jgi:DNA polymerase I
MRVSRHYVAGDECLIHFLETDADLLEFDEFLARGDQVLGLDTETSGLDLFVAGHQLRLVQFGNATEAWVLRADKFADAIIQVLRSGRRFVAHNASYDLLVLDRHLGVSLEDLMPRVFDTRIMAHLLDPRGKEEGGIGLDLKSLSALYVDSSAPDTQEDLTGVFNAFGWTKRSGWSRISIDHSTYVLYAGLDAILVCRLFQAISRAISSFGALSRFEHQLQYLLAILMRKGMPLDVPYVERLEIELLNEYVDYCDIAADLGLENVNSPNQVAQMLLSMGEKLTERTPEGNLKVDRAVLSVLADLDRQWERIGAREPNPVAEAVMRAKRAGKWAEAYAGAFLEHRDPQDRLHPTIRSLQARTGRMSVANPPLQQLPSGEKEWRVRRAFVPDPGHVMIACDYQAVEMRVLAALSNELTMQSAISQGVDLHSFTAERVFGEGFTKQHRKIAKAVGFGKVYGGGATTISRQTGADISSVRQALRAYDQTFPGIKRYAWKLAERAKHGKREVVTPIGRHLPLDEERIYAATNYVVQSTSRDLLAQAVIRLFEKGLGDYLLLPIHDELLGQAPEADAEDVVHEIGRVMECSFQGVAILSSPAVVGASWGSAYGAPAVLPDVPLERKERRLRAGKWAQESLELAM